MPIKATISRVFSVGRLSALVLLASLLVFRIFDPTFLANIRNQSFDLYQQTKPRSHSPQPIAIVDIDEQSLRDVGQWPWSRVKLAHLVTKIAGAGSVAMAFDIVFSELDRLSPENIARDNQDLPQELRQSLRKLPENDKLFAEAIKSTRVVVGQTSVRQQRDERQEKREIPSVQHAILGADPSPFLLKFPELVENLPEIEDAAAGRGMFSVRPDADGIYRNVPIVMTVDGKIRLALSTELLRVATGQDAFAVRSDAAGVSELVVANQLIKTTRNGTIWPYFSPFDPSRYLSAADILADKIRPGSLAGKLVFIGTTAVGLEDYRATPLGHSMPGVEIHAQVLENILGKTTLIRPNYAAAAELVAITLLSLLVIILVPSLGALWTIICALVLLGGYVGFSYFMFWNHRLLIDPTFPSIATVLTLMLMASANYLREEGRRKQIRDAFGQYVSPALVTQLSEDPKKLRLGGEVKVLSILFSDVRGFTSISESYKENPTGLTELMNKLLTVLSDAVLRHGGTIDKFMGDAIMAFWNAPLDNKNHAVDACRTALDIQKDIETLNIHLLEEHREAGGHNDAYRRIDVGIGINTGDCVVGNMGSQNRFDYTALGDAVNIASRLEGQSKSYGISIVMGEATGAEVEDKLALLEIDQIRVKGKHEPERIFGLFGDETLANSADFKAFRALNKTMLMSYRNQDWMSAFEALELLLELEDRLELGLNDYFFIYESRIAEFKANPPGRSWDGVYTAVQK